jgi:cyclomaltodextrinase
VLPRSPRGPLQYVDEQTHGGDRREYRAGCLAGQRARAILAQLRDTAPVYPGLPRSDWTADAIWYQVLVPRFANGAPENDPPYVRPWQGDWGVPDDDDSRPVRTQLFTRAYGGDLQGLREKLAYLQDLGVNTLYLNPIFSAPSEHKYDTADLRHVDDTLAVAGALAGAKSESADPASWGWTASDRYFLSFLNDAHARGFRVVLDGVFNHVGCDFWAFQDVRARGRASAYADWFDIFQWEPGLKYRAWDGENGQLPEFRRAGDGLHPAVEAHVFRRRSPLDGPEWRW